MTATMERPIFICHLCDRQWGEDAIEAHLTAVHAVAVGTIRNEGHVIIRDDPFESADLRGVRVVLAHEQGFKLFVRRGRVRCELS